MIFVKHILFIMKFLIKQTHPNDVSIPVLFKASQLKRKAKVERDLISNPKEKNKKKISEGIGPRCDYCPRPTNANKGN